MKRHVAIEEIQIGMETASAVLNKFGQALLPQNLKIEEKHFTILKTWGIKSIEVKDYSAATEMSGADESLLSQIRSDLQIRLGWELKNRNEEDLFEMAVQKAYEDNINGRLN